MKVIVYILILLSLILSNFPSDHHLKCWDGVLCLKLDDFQGQELSDSVVSIMGLSRKPAALSVLEYGLVEVPYDTVNKYRYRGQFNKKMSWLDKDGSLLSHEQTHFNIQELIIRKANMLMDSVHHHSDNLINYDSLEVELSKNLDHLDRLFDLETEYGANTQKNREWVIKIANNVEALNKYRVKCDH